MATMDCVDTKLVFGGEQRRYQHDAATTQCRMTFSVYLPPQVAERKVPVLYWLSGLTCTDENFSTKAGAQRVAAQLGMALVMPDTSPRGEGVPDDPEGAYDFGLGAGFYVNATQAPWSTHYRMYDYVVEELPALVESTLPLDGRRAIAGHSMGGHGALMIALRNPDRYISTSAFSPIVNPAGVPWGRKALGRYLGEDPAAWAAYDTVALVEQTEHHLPLLVDQGAADQFLEEQLKTDRLEAACESSGYPAMIRMHGGYDHSYYFIASFIEDHLRFHYAAITAGQTPPD